MERSLDGQISALRKIYSTETLTLALFSGQVRSFPCTFSSGSPNISVPGHDFVEGTCIRFANSGGSLPPEFASGTNYWVVISQPNQVQLSASPAGYSVGPDMNTIVPGSTIITPTSNGSGSHSILEAPPIQTINSRNVLVHVPALKTMVATEVDYNGSGRQGVIAGNFCIDMVQGSARSVAEIVATFTPTTSINFRYVGLIRGGNITRQNTNGVLDHIKDMGFIMNIGPTGYEVRLTLSIP